MKDRDGEGSGLARPGLSLSDNVVTFILVSKILQMHMYSTTALTLNDWHDGALLDGRGSLETVGIHTTKKFGLQIHRVEGVCGFIVVGLDLAY